MDPAQGETQGKSITSKLKAKVKGVKSKVHLPGHKKRHGDDGQGNEGDSSDYSSDDSPKKPGPETGYNVGHSTPFTTVRTTPLSPVREKPSSRESHNRDYDSQPSHTTSGYDSQPSHTTSGYNSQPSHTTSGYNSQPSHTTSGYDTHHSPSTPPTLDEKFQYREGGNTTSITEGMAKMGYDENPSSPTKPREGVLGKVKDSVGGAAAVVGSKMGYYTEVEQTPVVPSPRDPNAPSVIDKAKASLGMDKPSDPNAPTLMEKTKATLGLDKPSDPNAPTLMEKTKATLGLDKPSDPNAPTLMEKTKATLGLGPSSPNSVTSATSQPSQPSQPGVVDRVTGAVSSLFSGSPKGSTGEDVQHTFPAQSDYVPPAATVPHQSYGGQTSLRLHD
ncbi:hypothetical protein KC19_4G147000 [Ceratodon purpureus]|uniref:Uncharacterized protein n=1 Tax=Ceratodon purpureus TaxID=3225 RepID=A0A8T0I8P2_CERPU|nr:hypothetical protein KC19_4G147000 [Ceratodon purpureus]